MRILCIDDKPEELERAKKAVTDANHEFVGILMDGSSVLEDHLQEFRDADAVITDLQYIPLSTRHKAYRDIPTNCPGGLLAVIVAMHFGKPVVVCTEIKTRDHHGPELGWIHDSLPLETSLRKSPLYIVESKMWDYAVESIVRAN